MKKIVTLLLLIASLISFESCKKRDTPPVVANRTVLVYMAPDRNLYRDMMNNISDMILGMNGVKGNLLVYMRAPQSNPQLIQILSNGTQKVVKNYPSGSVYSAADVASVLGEVKRDYPAGSYGLILSSHGDGWIPRNLSLGAVRSMIPRDSLGSHLYKPEYNIEFYEQLWQRPEGAIMTKAFGPDSRNRINIEELSQALPSDRSLDFLLFDACFMASIEVAYELRENAKYIISSPAEVMGYGFPYRKVVSAMMSETSDFRGICEAFMSFYRSYYIGGSSYYSGTISLINTSELSTLAEVTKEIFASSPNVIDTEVSNIQFFERMSNHVFYDLDCYVELSCSNPLLYTRFKQQLQKAVPFSDFTPTVYSGFGYSGFFKVNRSCGLTTYISHPSFPIYNAAHNKTSWVNATVTHSVSAQ